MEKVERTTCEKCADECGEAKVFTPYPGADEKYDDGKDWRLYNPEKYHDPNWSPDKE